MNGYLTMSDVHVIGRIATFAQQTVWFTPDSALDRVFPGDHHYFAPSAAAHAPRANVPAIVKRVNLSERSVEYDHELALVIPGVVMGDYVALDVNDCGRADRVHPSAAPPVLRIDPRDVTFRSQRTIAEAAEDAIAQEDARAGAARDTDESLRLVRGVAEIMREFRLDAVHLGDLKVARTAHEPLPLPQAARSLAPAGAEADDDPPDLFHSTD